MSILNVGSSGGASQIPFQHIHQLEISQQPQQPQLVYPQLNGVNSNFTLNIPTIPTFVSSAIQQANHVSPSTAIPSTGLYPDLGCFPHAVDKTAAITPLHGYNFYPKINTDIKTVNLISKIGSLFKKTNDVANNKEDVKKHFVNMFEAVCNNFNLLNLQETNFDKLNFNSNFQLFYKQDVSQLLIAFFNSTLSWPLSERIELFETCLKKCDEKITNSNKESFKKFLKHDLFLMLIVDRSNHYQSIQAPKEKEEFKLKTAEFFMEVQRLFPLELILNQDKEFEKAICHLGYWGRLNLFPLQNAHNLAKAVESLYTDYFLTPIDARKVDSYFAQINPLPSAPPLDAVPTTVIYSPPSYADDTAQIPIQPQVVQQAPVIVQQVKSEVFVDDEHKTNYPFDRKREPVNFKIEKEYSFCHASDLPWLNKLSLVERFALLQNIQFPAVSGVAESHARESLEKRFQTRLMAGKFNSVEAWIEGLIHEVKSTIINQRHELKDWGNSIVNGEISKRSEEDRKVEIRMWIDRAAQKGEIVDIGAFYRMTWKKGGRIENGDLDWGKNHAADSHELFSESFNYFAEKGYLS